MKRNLKNVLLVGGLITVAAGFLAHYALDSIMSSSVPQWVITGISAMLGIAASLTLTSMGFSLDQDLLKKTDYTKMEKRLSLDDKGKWYTKYVKKSDVPEEVTAN